MITSTRNRLWDESGNEGNTIWFEFMNALIAQGWRVLGSGDGNSFENDGQTAGATGTGVGGGFDVITTSSVIQQIVLPDTVASEGRVGNWGNYSGFPDNFGASWRRIATPAGADHYCEYLFQVDSIDEQVLVRYCRGSQRFDSGATAWGRPNVNTGTALMLGTRNSVEQGQGVTEDANGFLPSTDGRAHWWIGDSSVDYDFLYWSHRKGFNGDVQATFGRLRVTGGPQRTDSSDDPDPYLLICQLDGAGFTGHKWLALNDVFRATEAAPNRMEDRVSVFSGDGPYWVSSYGLDDPGVAASNQGHYGGSLVNQVVQTGSGYQSLFDNVRLVPTDRRQIVTAIPVVFAGNVSSQEYYKGVLKNDLFGLCGSPTAIPVVEKGPDPSDPIRVRWGFFSVYWGASEAVEDIY